MRRVFCLAIAQGEGATGRELANALLIPIKSAASFQTRSVPLDLNTEDASHAPNKHF